MVMLYQTTSACSVASNAYPVTGTELSVAQRDYLSMKDHEDSSNPALWG